MSSPIKTFLIGKEKTAIFQNDSEHGRYLLTKLEGRSYKDNTGSWLHSYNYNAIELAAHIAVCQTTLNYMITEAPSN